MSIHNLRACGSDASASDKSAGNLGSGQDVQTALIWKDRCQ
jgi:hypothetical protein